MSLRIVPADAHTSTFTHIRPSAHGAPSAPGLHDTLRAGVGPDPFSQTNTSTLPSSAHPLEARLKQWETTQENLRMESLRRTFGVAEPIRRGMELKITREGQWRPMALGGSATNSVHEDILKGRDASVDWEDIFTGEEQRSAVGVHDEMERKLKI
ncbi:proteasome maturation factor UMP1-domain-containing protein [Coniella lustricola]|uniref:Proteasome maturation factor UMP1-domain-containing protein n=1 Tax=Coniella lustricola TaxID=2025994 RepID=A0A2T3ABT4_9PEZI|nr:proteasome maturation factor UMP1-domain-containing protein [Coniella lustricola]